MASHFPIPTTEAHEEIVKIYHERKKGMKPFTRERISSQLEPDLFEYLMKLDETYDMTTYHGKGIDAEIFSHTKNTTGWDFTHEYHLDVHGKILQVYDVL